MDTYLFFLRGAKESLIIEYALKKRSELNKHSHSIFGECWRILEGFEDEFDDSWRIKTTSDLSKECPSVQNEIETWYDDMHFLMNTIQNDMFNPPAKSGLVSHTVLDLIKSHQIECENIPASVLPLIDQSFCIETESGLTQCPTGVEQPILVSSDENHCTEQVNTSVLHEDILSEVNCETGTSDCVTSEDINPSPLPSQAVGQVGQKLTGQPDMCEVVFVEQGDEVLNIGGAPENPTSNNFNVSVKDTLKETATVVVATAVSEGEVIAAETESTVATIPEAVAVVAAAASAAKAVASTPAESVATSVATVPAAIAVVAAAASTVEANSIAPAEAAPSGIAVASEEVAATPGAVAAAVAVTSTVSAAAEPPTGVVDAMSAAAAVATPEAALDVFVGDSRVVHENTNVPGPPSLQCCDVPNAAADTVTPMPWVPDGVADGIHGVSTDGRIYVNMSGGDNSATSDCSSNFKNQGVCVIRPCKKPPDPERSVASPNAPRTCMAIFENVANSGRMYSPTHHEDKWYATGIGVDKSASKFLGCVQTTTSAKCNKTATDLQGNVKNRLLDEFWRSIWKSYLCN